MSSRIEIDDLVGELPDEHFLSLWLEECAEVSGGPNAIVQQHTEYLPGQSYEMHDGQAVGVVHTGKHGPIWSCYRNTFLSQLQSFFEPLLPMSISSLGRFV